MGIRSFLAFELSLGIQGILQDILQEVTHQLRDVRWVPLKNIHLTLIFLGEIQEAHLEPVCQEVQRACERYGPFHMKLTKLGVFGSLQRPRVLWVGMEGDVERMGYLKASLEKGLRPFCTKLENRAFKPHLTLGRFREQFRDTEALKALLMAHKSLGDTGQIFDEICLFKSQLSDKGSIYTKLFACKLSGKR